MDLKPKELLSIPEQIAIQLKKKIILGELKPGEKLPSEEKLSGLFKVSRPTLRNALKILSDTKLIYSKPGAGGGHFISEMNLETITNEIGSLLALSLNLSEITVDEIIEIRKTIEIKACKLATKKRTEKDLLKFEEYFRHIEFEMDNNDIDFYLYEFKFHKLIAEATHNDFLIIIFNSISNALESRYKSIKCPPNLRRKLVKEILNIYDSIKKQDIKEATRKMSNHLRHFEDFFADNE